MKKLSLSLALMCMTTTIYATEAKSIKNVTNDLTNSQEVIENNKYMTSVFKFLPDMQEKGEKSKQKSLKDGAALQVVSGSIQFYNTGLTPESLSSLINVESKGIKKYYKEKKTKGYFFINHDILISKGYPELEKKELERFKSQANCKNGYCSVAVVTGFKLIDQNGKEQDFNRKELAQYIKNEDTKNDSLEINPKLIKTPYSMIPLNLNLVYGLNGNDALEFLMSKK